MAYEGNRYAGLNRKGPDDKAGWLGAAGTVAGAGLGLLAGPGGMAAGAKLGGALGGVTHDAVNGTLTPQSAIGDVAQGVSGFKGLNGAMDNKSILEAFMRDPSQFRVGFANGGLVTGPAMAQTQDWLNMDPVQRAMLQAQQAAGPAPVAPVPAQTQQAQHPTLEALSSLLPQIMAAMPRPANPKNTKAIGAWLPAAGLALSAPAAVAQSRRASANAPIEQANTTARSDYEARRKAYEDRKTKISDTLVRNATKPFAPSTDNTGQRTGLDEPMDEATAMQVTGDRSWAGRSIRQWNARKKPVAGVSGSSTISPRARRIANAIKSGNMRPNAVSSLPPRDPIRAEVMDVLATEGVDLNTMAYDITAETKFWQTQNDSKRTTIRTQLNTLSHTIPYTRGLIQQAKEIIPDFSTQGFNRVTLTAAANLPGPRGVLARKLVAQIGDIGAEVGTLYMGGNSNTDESFRLAEQNIQADWSEEQLMAALDQIEMNTGIRLNAIKDVRVSKPTSDEPIKSIEAY